MPAVHAHPDVSEVIPFPRAEIGRWVRTGNLLRIRAWVRTLRERGYDLAVDLQGLFRSGAIAIASGAPRRVGFADAREFGWIGYSERIRVAPGLHHIDRYRALLEHIGVPWVNDLRLYAPADSQRDFEQDPLATRRYVLLAPTTRGAGRAWPMDRYARVAADLLRHAESLGIDAVAVAGLAQERDQCAPLIEVGQVDSRLIDRVGRTSLGGLMELVRHAALVVCNDSAAMHLAVAYGRPLVALFGPTRVELAGPYGRPNDVLCRRRADERVRHRDVARSLPLMERITVDDVLDACRARLASASKKDPANVAGSS